MLGVISGIVGGLSVIIFIEMTKINQYILFEILLDIINIEILGFEVEPILISAIRDMLVGPLIYKYAPETKGHGVPEIMESIKLHKGFLY